MRHITWKLIVLLIAPITLLNARAEQGEATISLVSMTLQTNTDFFEDTQRETDFVFDFWQNLANYGQLEGRLVFADLNGEFEEGSFTFGIRDLWLNNDTVVNALIGDHNIYYRSIPEFFLNYQIPTVFVRGAFAEITNHAWYTHFFLGRVEQRKGITGNSFEQSEQSIYGMKFGKELPGGSFIGGGFLRTEGEQDPAGNLSFRTNNLLLLDGRLGISDGLSLSGEYIYCQYNHPTRGTIEDSSLIAGPMLRRDNLSIQMNYRKIGRDFQFISPFYQIATNQEGAYTDVNYRFKKIYLYGSSDYYWDDPTPEMQRNSLSTWASHLGASLSPKDAWYINFSSSIIRKNASSEIHPIDDLRYDILAGTSGYFIRKKLNPYIRVRYRQDRRDEPISNVEKEPNAVLGLGWRPTDRLRMECETEFRTVSNTLKTKDESIRSLELLLHWRPLSTRLSLDPGIEFSKTHDRLIDDCKNKWAFNLGLGQQLHGGWRFSLTSRWSKYSGLHRRSYLDVKFNMAKTFHWGHPVLRLGVPQQGQKLVCGTIRGYIFIDENGDQTRQPWETGIPNIPVVLDSRFVYVTDSSGEFFFENVLIGKHKLSIEMQAVPLEYELKSFQQDVEIKVRTLTEVFFPVKMQTE